MPLINEEREREKLKGLWQETYPNQGGCKAQVGSSVSLKGLLDASQLLD